MTTERMQLRLRVVSHAVQLAWSRGSDRLLHLISLLISVHYAGLPVVRIGEFRKSVAASSKSLSSSVKMHPFLTGVGSGSVAEMVALASLVAATQPRKLLEFGTCDGASTWHLWANAHPDSVITTLDLPAGTKTSGSTDPGLQGIGVRPLLPDDSRIRVIEIDSRTWVPDVDEVDFCFIDAGHSYECVKNDTEKALSVMRRGGLLLWHDASWRRDGYGVNGYLRDLRAAGRDVFLLDAGPYEYCALAALIV